MICSGKLLDQISDWKCFAFASTYIVKWFEAGFEEKCHGPKACSLEVKVKLHVLFLLRFRCVLLFLQIQSS